MSTAPQVIVPNPRIPRTIGVLNIVFGAVILLFGVCTGAYIAVMPMFGKAMEDAQKQLTIKAEAQKQADLDALAAREEAAETDEEKDAIKQERARIEARPAFNMNAGMDFRKMGLTDRRFVRYMWTDLTTMLVLNVLMIASGIGLVRYRSWGRSLGVWVAGLKIVRLCILQIVWIAVVVPVLAHGMGTAIGEMMAQQQAAMGAKAPVPAAQQMTKAYGVMYTIMGVATILLGSIYPAICLWLLNKRGVKAACPASKRPGSDVLEFDQP